MPSGTRVLLHITAMLLTSIAYARTTAAQPGVSLGTLVSAATDFNVYGQFVRTQNSTIGPEYKEGARGIGFEFAFGLPGVLTARKREVPGPLTRQDTLDASNPARCRFKYRELLNGPATSVDRDRFFCEDTLYAPAERQIGGRDTTYKQAFKEIRPFKPTTTLRDTVVTFELALGFSQAGAFVSRRPEDTLRVSIRELPSASVYATFEISEDFSPYVGVRTGMLSLQGGRLYSGTAVTKFGGDTFQIGPVLGIVVEQWGVNMFGEVALMRRRFDNVEWEEVPPETLRKMSFSGPALAFGGQLHFRDPK